MMTVSIWAVILMMLVCVLTVLGSVLLGAYVMFKGKTSVPGERFIGGAPKGQVFTISEAEETPDFPDEVEQNILAKTTKFLNVLGAGGKS